MINSKTLKDLLLTILPSNTLNKEIDGGVSESDKRVEILLSKVIFGT